MRKFSFLVAFIILCHTYAQSQEVCSDLTDLGMLPTCQTTLYSNLNATTSDIGNENIPSCFITEPQRDVWFSFTVAPDIIDYSFTIEGIDANGQPLTHIQAAIYRGFCATDALAVRDCFIGEADSTRLQFDIFNMTPNEQLYLRIADYTDTAMGGEFSLCIEEVTVEYTVDQTGATECRGTLFDTGGPDSNYDNNENHVFTICPASIHSCLRFDLEYYNVEEGTEASGDKIIFYNGSNTQSEVLTILGQEAGYSVAHGGGGVCHSVFADDCLTIQFLSDATISFEGFKGKWSCSLTPCNEINPITILDNVGPDAILDAISTPFTQVTIDTIICPNGGYGIFEANDNAGIGLNNGLLLTTGSPQNAIGPNTKDDATSQNNGPGDTDLDILSSLFGGSNESFDACVVELDVFVISDELRFEYVFGSEEYSEFIDTEFNDIFALLVSGPGISGITQIGNQKNMAILPDNGQIVEINNVNHKKNWEYYRNNAYGEAIEYDGFTTGKNGIKKSLTATQTVIPCNTYHLKFAIGDRGDTEFDSGVFIGEITSGLPMIETNFSTQVDFLIEGCGIDQNKIKISINDEIAEDISFSVNIGGTAQRNSDYTTNIPDVISFEAGQVEQEFSIASIVDDLAEGEENIIIQLLTDSECGIFMVDELEIKLKDKLELDLVDSAFVCRNMERKLSVDGAANYNWSPFPFVDNPSSNEPTLFGDASRWYTVTGSIPGVTGDGCTATDSVWVEVIDPTFGILIPNNQTLCERDSIVLLSQTSHPADSYNWQSLSGTFIDPLSPSTIFIGREPTESAVIIGQAMLGGCTVRDTLVVAIDEFHFPNFRDRDTICQGQILTLGSDDLSMSTQYTWSPNVNISATDQGRVMVNPQESTVYTLLAQSENNYCQQTDQIEVTVIPNNIAITTDNSHLCVPQTSTTLTTTIIPNNNNPQIQWEDIQGNVIQTDAQSLSISPKVSTQYIAVWDNDVCQARDTFLVSVDSLPAFIDLDIVPSRAQYCKGERAVLISNPIDAELYPNIMYAWTDQGIIETPLNNLNIGIATDSTRTYTRIITNGGCTSTDQIEVQVVNLQIEVEDPVSSFGENSYEIAFGSEVTISAIEASLIDADYEFTWCINNQEIGTNESSLPYTQDEDQATVMLKMQNNLGCRDTASVVIITGPPQVEFPNAFIPSATNEYNKTFRYFAKIGDEVIDSAPFENVDFRIYNRWGTEVYTCDNVRCAEQGWNGIYKGKLAPTEVYTWIFSADWPMGQTVQKQGTFTLLR